MRLLQPLFQLGIREDLRYRLQRPANQYACLVAIPRPRQPGGAEAGGDELPSIVGTLELAVRRPFWTSDRYIYISNVAVDSGFRRRGIAQKLLQASEAVGRSWGLSRLDLHVMTDNLPARRLYARAGYTVRKDDRSFDIFQRSKRMLLRKDLA